MKKRSIVLNNEKWKQLKVKVKNREVWEPVLLMLILFLVIASVIGFSYFGSNTQKSEEQNNLKMISELNDINSYLNELDESVTNNKETLESVTENSSTSIPEEVVNSKEEINLTIDEGITELNTKMEILHTKISETEASIKDLLANLSLDVEENQQQNNLQFSEIKEEFADMIDEVKELLEQIFQTQEANRAESKEVLNMMETDIETNETENLDKMMEILTSMEESYTTLLKDCHADTINSITDSKDGRYQKL